MTDEGRGNPALDFQASGTYHSRVEVTLTSNYRIQPIERAGYEIVERYDHADGIRASICLWLGDFKTGRILDRVTGQPVDRRCVASVKPSGSGFSYKLHAGAKGGWRYGWTQTYEQALDAIDKWARRRLTRTSEVAR